MSPSPEARAADEAPMASAAARASLILVMIVSPLIRQAPCSPYLEYRPRDCGCVAAFTRSWGGRDRDGTRQAAKALWSQQRPVPMKIAAPAAFALALALLPTVAVAETPQERDACMNDAFRVCFAAIPDQD